MDMTDARMAKMRAMKLIPNGPASEGEESSEGREGETVTGLVKRADEDFDEAVDMIGVEMNGDDVILVRKDGDNVMGVNEDSSLPKRTPLTHPRVMKCDELMN